MPYIKNVIINMGKFVGFILFIVRICCGYTIFQVYMTKFYIVGLLVWEETHFYYFSRGTLQLGHIEGSFPKMHRT